MTESPLLPQPLGMTNGQWQMAKLKAGRTARMSCGGELRRVEKKALRDRISPKTYRWLDEYFVCAHCDHLFWRGTHWTRIQQQLRLAGAKGGTARLA